MSAAARARPLRVVVIDDTADLRDLLRLALGRGGYDVVGEAGDGRRGIEVVRELRPDLVLLDLSMPVMDGLEALPSIRRAVPRAKVVVLSGFGATQMSERALAAGADGYVQKGASLDSLLTYVAEVTAGPPAARAPRPLSVVTTPEPTADDTAPVPEADSGATPAPTSAGQVSWWQALSLAPMGILELADEPVFRIVFANTTAQRLLGPTAAPGTPLGFVSGPLATLVAYHRLDADASFEVELDGGSVRATMRRTGWSVLVFLDSTADDVGLLRRAIATTAHEIRGPVAVICGIAEASDWGESDLEPEVRGRLMGSVARQARMLDSITADLLTAAQIQHGTLRLDLRPVRPRQVIESLVHDRYRGDPDLVVEVRIDDDREVQADALRLEQMVGNLLGNALKYARAPFLVHVRGEGERVCIDVVDHGPGVPEDFRGDLFREFTRASGTVATGTGLGLYVVRTLAEAQHASIAYAPGRYGGSVFTISLAAAQEPLLAESPVEGVGGAVEQ
ncbi:signal transduction histidine kinase/CheY-like chemotaxis protein [Nocardioides salarius]|uniref:histidine kinase n=1 Tax=Nocardioides salarius TaxID=374513 RepID=A0ABS2MBQ8_9ACTN|nr:response regulator [Nocardioides salarius]MBM7508632.1 signal transduction histidine kinase/CheY-like chemotaxis protein [Nocardioides salarius]